MARTGPGEDVNNGKGELAVCDKGQRVTDSEVRAIAYSGADRAVGQPLQ